MTALPILVPLAGAALLAVLHGRRKAAGIAAVVTLLATLGAAVWTVRVGTPLVWQWGPGLSPRLAAEGFGRVMTILVPAIAAPVAAYAAADRDETAPVTLLGLMLLFVAAMEILVLAGDLLTLLFGWELVGALSWALIGHRWRDPAAGRAARQAFLTTRFGDLGLYLAAAAAFAGAGSLDYASLSDLTTPASHVVAGGILLAAAAKSAQLPFSPWLFSAMAGPTPVSALLHSATLVAAGAYALIRLAPALEGTGWFGPAAMAVGLATALAGGIVAALQDDIKRSLAGSTSSQYGLMFLAAGAGSAAAAGAHLVAHAAFKSLLFLGAGVAIHAAGTGDLRRMRLGHALPRTAFLFAIGILALAAVPPLGGAWTKEAVVSAAFEADPGIGVLALTSGLLTAFYAARLHLLAFGRDRTRTGRKPRGGESAGMVVLAVYTVLLAALWLPGAERSVEAAVPGREFPHPEAWGFWAAVGAIAVAAILAWFLRRRSLLFAAGIPEKVRAAAADWIGIPTLARAAVGRPTLALARMLATFDDRVIDAGVRGAVAAGRALSRALALWGERGIEGVVWGLVGATLSTARGSRAVDDGAVDGAVEGAAWAVGLAGRWSRRLQTGMAHHYYIIVAAGVLGAVTITLLLR